MFKFYALYPPACLAPFLAPEATKCFSWRERYRHLIYWWVNSASCVDESSISSSKVNYNKTLYIYICKQRKAALSKLPTVFFNQSTAFLENISKIRNGAEDICDNLCHSPCSSVRGSQVSWLCSFFFPSLFLDRDFGARQWESTIFFYEWTIVSWYCILFLLFFIL